jgi:type II secretory pathway pseudopilin PulG
MGAAHETRAAMTLIELMIVFVIIALMLGLLFPAVQFSNQASGRIQCQSNLQQLGIAMTTYIDVHRAIPAVEPQGRIGGWAIAILPFMEDGKLAEALSGYPRLDSVPAVTWARERPKIMTCPAAYGGTSSVASIPVCHYAAHFYQRGRIEKCSWGISDVPIDTDIPWVVTPLNDDRHGAKVRGPHGDEFNSIGGIGRQVSDVTFSGDRFSEAQ